MTDQLLLTIDGRGEAGAACSITIAFLGREYPQATDPEEHEVIRVEVAVSAFPFHGRYESSIWSRELVRLRTTLAELSDQVGHESAASFHLRERAFDVVFRMTVLGHLTLEVIAHGDPGVGPDLHFSIEADQSYLPGWIRQVDAVLQEYP